MEGHNENKTELSELDSVRVKFLKHLYELGLRPTELHKETLEQLRQESILQKNGVAYAAHDRPVTKAEVGHVENASLRFSQADVKITSFIDQDNFLYVIINPIIN